MHQLLVLVYRWFDANKSDEVEFPEEYREFGVSPSAIHKSKDAHKEAIKLLLDDMVESQPTATAPTSD